MLKRFYLACAALVMLALSLEFGAKVAAGHGGVALVAMTNYPRLQYSAVAAVQAGGIYFGHLQQWSRVGTAPGRPVSIWSRDSNGGILRALENGDLYQVGSPTLPVGESTLTYDSNVFLVPTQARERSWGSLKVRAN